jgi:filamentous hemagglutinin family protein
MHKQSLFSASMPLRHALNLAILTILYPSLSHANPDGAQVVSGQVSIDSATPGVTAVTNSPNAIINWQNFSIAQNEMTRFIQQNGQSAVLNRIIGQNPSEILGQLTSNGKVFLINPNGVVFGPGSVVDTQGLVASSLNLSDQDFLSGNYHFMAGSNAGDIVNEGIIRAGKDGNIVLIAPHIENNGIIQSDGGSITLAAGHELTITNLDDPEIRFQIQAPADSVVNLGKLLTEGGAINVFAGTIKHSGEISADSVEIDAQGNIRLVAQQDITLAANSKISANSSQGDAGTIHLDSKAGTTLAQGTITAQATQTGSSTPLAAGQGGRIEVLGERVGVLDQALINVSGQNGGGKVLIGGGYQGKNPALHNAKATYIGKDAVIKADALTAGDGGKVIVWSDESTRAYGAISATGGSQSGNGGFIETSGHWLDTAGIRVNALAPHGRGGEWLLDPYNIIIVSDSYDILAVVNPFNSSSSWTATSASSYLRSSAINAQLNNGTSITLYTGGATGAEAGNITVSDNISKTAGSDATLHLKADNSVIVSSSVSIGSTNNKLNTILNADTDANGAGNIQMGASSSITSNGGNIVMGGGTCTSTGCTASATGYADATGQREGIYLAGSSGNLVSLNSGGGNIFLKGNGLTTAGSGQYDYGVFLNYASLNSSGGTLNITGNGGGTGNWSINEGIHAENSTLSSGAGNLTLSGLGGNGNGGDSGINLTSTGLTTTSGTLQIDGTGGSTGTGAGNYGIQTLNTALTSSTGNIILNGTGGNGTNQNWGNNLHSTTFTTTSGNLNITGTGQGSGTNNYGIYSYSATTMASGTGSITLDGRGAGSAAGLRLDTGTVIGSASGQTGNISLIADTAAGSDSIVMTGATAPKIQSGGTLTLKPLNNATTIGLAGGTGIFNLSATELGYIENVFSNITIGNSTGTGLITLGASGWTVPSLSNLMLQNTGTSSNGITVNGALTVDNSKTLTLSTKGLIANTAAISGGIVNLFAATGIIQNGDITAYGNITLTANGNSGTGNFIQKSGTLSNTDTVNPGNITINAYDIQVGSTNSRYDVTLNAAHNIRILSRNSFISGGTAQDFHEDDESFAYTLPFGFTYYGVTYTTMYVSSNGIITFGGGAWQYINSSSGLIAGVNGLPTIAPSWSDWVTYSHLGKDIYIHQPSANTLAVRWDVAHYRDNDHKADFEAVLSQLGYISFNYGAATAMVPDYTATIGVSKGDGIHYTLSAFDNPTDMNNLSSSLFSYDAISGNYIETLRGSIIETNIGETIAAVNNISLIAAETMSINNPITATTIYGQSVGDMTLGTLGTLTSSGTGNAIVLNSSAGNFINYAGSTALSNTGGGRWLVYSTSPTLNTFGGLESGHAYLWSKTYASYAPANVVETGNRYLFSRVDPVAAQAAAEAAAQAAAEAAAQAAAAETAAKAAAEAAAKAAAEAAAQAAAEAAAKAAAEAAAQAEAEAAAKAAAEAAAEAAAKAAEAAAAQVAAEAAAKAAAEAAAKAEAEAAAAQAAADAAAAQAIADAAAQAAKNAVPNLQDEGPLTPIESTLAESLGDVTSVVTTAQSSNSPENSDSSNNTAANTADSSNPASVKGKNSKQCTK